MTTVSESSIVHVSERQTTSDPRLFILKFRGLPTYGERYQIEAALSICRVYVQDFRYDFNKQTLTYKLRTEQYSYFQEHFSKTHYWNNIEISYVSRP
jgi:hypothetical protein